MNRLELIDKQEQIEKRLNELINSAEVEKRKLNEGEETEFNNLQVELTEVKNKLKEVKDFVNINENNKTNTRKMEKKVMNMSLLKILKETKSGQQSEETRAIIKAGKEEARNSGIDLKSEIILPTFDGVEERAINIGSEEAGHAAVQVNKTNILSPLLNELVAVQAGATVLTGLVGDVNVPSLNDISATWEGETAETAGQSPTFSSVDLKPKRLSVVIPISNTWLEQDSVGAENAIRQLIIDKVKIKLEETIFGAAAETAGKIPAGLLNGATAKGALTFDNIVAMEGDLLENNVKPACYVVHPKLMVKAKATKVDAGSGKMVYEGGQMNGYPVYATNSVASGLATAKDEYGVLMGDFKNLYICFWNGIGIQTDPYTLAGANQTRLIVNLYVDAKVVRDGAIKAYSMK